MHNYKYNNSVSFNFLNLENLVFKLSFLKLFGTVRKTALFLYVNSFTEDIFQFGNYLDTCRYIYTAQTGKFFSTFIQKIILYLVKKVKYIKYS